MGTPLNGINLRPRVIIHKGLRQITQIIRRKGPLSKVCAASTCLCNVRGGAVAQRIAQTLRDAANECRLRESQMYHKKGKKKGTRTRGSRDAPGTLPAPQNLPFLTGDTTP